MNTFQKLIALVFILTLFNCGDGKKTDDKSAIKLKDTSEKTIYNTNEQDSLVALISQGKKLFNTNACAGCHMPNETGIGPSIKDITSIYAKQDGDYIAYFRGEAEPIVDTDPNQVLLMKNNLDLFIKKLNDNQLKALVAYMKSID